MKPRIYSSLVLLSILSSGLVACKSPQPPVPVHEAPTVAESKVIPPTNAPAPVFPQEMVLFDGKTLKNWNVTEHGGHGEVTVENGELRIGMGADLSSVNWTNGPLPKVNYEIEFDAMKVDGSDFFCGLTFPVRDSFCSLILGGWGGGVVGLSSLDGMDASENDTSRSLYFERNRWFHIRLRVLEESIQTWVDDKKIIDVVTKDRKIAMRPGDIERAVPLGFSTWQTTSALKNIKLRQVKPAAE